jgi:hypothetical protein
MILGVEVDVPGEVDLGDAVYAPRCCLADALRQVAVLGEEDLVRAERPDGLLLCGGSYDADDVRTVANAPRRSHHSSDPVESTDLKLTVPARTIVVTGTPVRRRYYTHANSPHCKN